MCTVTGCRLRNSLPDTLNQTKAGQICNVYFCYYE